MGVIITVVILSLPLRDGRRTMRTMLAETPLASQRAVNSIDAASRAFPLRPFLSRFLTTVARGD